MSKAGNLRVPDYLGHILEAIKRIHLYVENMAEIQFLGDAKTQDAVIRNFDIIGEACRNIDAHHPEFTQMHPQVPCGFAYEMRNALAHRYFKVDVDLVWTTIHSDPPNLAAKIGELLSQSHEA
jgi:uncharacterized protein with HEPN domain